MRYVKKKKKLNKTVDLRFETENNAKAQGFRSRPLKITIFLRLCFIMRKSTLASRTMPARFIRDSRHVHRPDRIQYVCFRHFVSS